MVSVSQGGMLQSAFLLTAGGEELKGTSTARQQLQLDGAWDFPGAAPDDGPRAVVVVLTPGHAEQTFTVLWGGWTRVSLGGRERYRVVVSPCLISNMPLQY